VKQSAAEKIAAAAIERLTQLRLKKEISFEELGGRTGLHPTALSLIERRKRQPTFINLLRVASALGVRFSKIVREAEDSL